MYPPPWVTEMEGAMARGRMGWGWGMMGVFTSSVHLGQTDVDHSQCLVIFISGSLVSSKKYDL